jgi:hypothetical protein
LNPRPLDFRTSALCVLFLNLVGAVILWPCSLCVSASPLASLPRASENHWRASVFEKAAAQLDKFFVSIKPSKKHLDTNLNSFARDFCCWASKMSNPLPNRLSKKEKRLSSPALCVFLSSLSLVYLHVLYSFFFFSVFTTSCQSLFFQFALCLPVWVTFCLW